MIIDAHVHVLNQLVVKNVLEKEEMTALLKLDVESIDKRNGKEALFSEMADAGINACLILPTANILNIKKVNSNFLALAESADNVLTAFTLHPDFKGNAEELSRFREKKIWAIKLCSFSQGFALDSERMIKMLDQIKEENVNNGAKFFVIFDTFYDASEYFGTEPAFNSTPLLLGEIVKNYPEINFITAHMGGLNAPFKEITDNLPASDNLYLDTSNAAHTLSVDEFTQLLWRHGPEHIIFGTDWPWFGIYPEVILIKRLIVEASMTGIHFGKIFAGNIMRLLDIKTI